MRRGCEPAAFRSTGAHGVDVWRLDMPAAAGTVIVQFAAKGTTPLEDVADSGVGIAGRAQSRRYVLMRGGVRRLTLWCAGFRHAPARHALSSPSQAGAADGSPDACAPTAELHFIWNVQRPEDLVVLPGERWLITSGYAEDSGLHVVDVERKTARHDGPPTRWPILDGVPVANHWTRIACKHMVSR